MACSNTNLFGITEYDGKCQFFGSGDTALPEGLGWFIIAGLGAVFAVLTSLFVWLDDKFTGAKVTSERFVTAGRSISYGLTCCDIVSKWTWAATLLQSSNVAYKFGVSGPFWYASGATIQVLLFSWLAVEIKRKAMTVHTPLEIIRCRWGKFAHVVFLLFMFATNIIVTSMLILGGAAVVEALTGVNVYAAAFIIPIGVMFYTAHGGLRATYLASWYNCTIIYIALCVFLFMVYTGSDDLGSISKVYDNLRAIENKYPVSGNKGGSYVTMFSQSGLIFGVINIVGNFGTVFVDQAYWQSAIAARPSATYKGYLMGGLCWFAIPFTMATTMGLAARALDLPVTIDESNSGLTPPALAVHLMGKGGAFLLVLQLFMAVISTANSEQLAVATLATYDIYIPYINRNASGNQILLLNRIIVCVYAVLSGVFASILLNFGLSLGWVYLFMGIIIGSAVFPMAASICWKKTSAFAALTAALVSLPLAIMTWLVTAATLNDGVVDLDTTGQDYPMLAGNLVALCLSSIICIVLSHLFPQNFDWNELHHMPVLEQDPDAEFAKEGQDSKEALDEVLNFTLWTGGILTFVLIIVWPCLALPAGVFSKGYFTFWVIIAFIWGVTASAVCVFTPLVENMGMYITLAKWALCGAPLPSATEVGSDIPDVKAKADVN